MKNCSFALLAFLLIYPAVVFSQASYTWTQKVPGSGHGNSLCVNPINPNIIYGSPNTNVVWISRNRGNTWVQLGNTGTSGGIAAIAVNPLDTNQIIVAQRSPSRVMKTTNHGQTWTQTWAGGSFNSFGVPFEHKPYFPNLVYVMGSSQFYRSEDFGSTWTMVATASFNAWCDAEISPLDDKTILLGTVSSGIWKSTNGGLSWTLKFTNGCSEIPMVAWSPSHPNIVYATRWGGCSSGMAKSTDGGETWTLIQNVPSSMWSLAVAPQNPDYVVACNYGTNMYISRNGGQSWTLTNTGLTGSGNGALVVDTFKVFALNGGIFKLNTPENVSTRNVRMVISVDANHGLDYHNDYPFVYPTSIWVKGGLPVLGSLQGSWTYNDTATGTLIRLYDNGTNGDITPGDNIWTRSITVPTGTDIGQFLYKYGAVYPGVDTVNLGVQYLNNESAINDFHTANFTDTDTVLVLSQDRWKTRGTVNATSVTVSLDLRGGADYYSNEPISSVTQSLWMKGTLPVLGRMAGNWTFPDTAIMVRLYDDGTHGDLVASDRIWMRTTVFPENTRFGAFSYKYAAVYPGVENNNGGVAYLNNEAASNVFHSTVLPESSLTLSISDQWLTRAGPIFQVTPESFVVSVPQGKQTTQTLSFANLAEFGSGTLTYAIRAEDTAFVRSSIFGSFQQISTGASRDRGNIYSVDQNSILREIRVYLGIPMSTDLHFFVYEGNTRNGIYNRIFQLPTTTGVGTKWYNSGPIDVNLRAGKFYYIGASWMGSVTYGKAFDSTFTEPIETEFGSLLTGQPITTAGYPPALTINGSQFSNTSAPFYQSVKVSTAQYITLSSSEGQIAPEASEQIGVTFDASNLAVGDYYPEFSITTNDPNNANRVVIGHVVVSPVVSTGDDKLLPTEFALLQNYPNPFNPATIIEYHLPTQRHVTLKIYDLLGKEVSTLVDRLQEPGRYTVSWDPRFSNSVASGVYFYRLIAGDFVRVHKMVLMK